MRSKFQILQKSFLGPTNSSNPLLQTCIIQNNTALKQAVTNGAAAPSFGTIRNNTALKPKTSLLEHDGSFGTIRNNTALKLRS